MLKKRGQIGFDEVLKLRCTPLTMTTDTLGSLGKQLDLDQAVEAFSHCLKAAGVHTSQVEPLPLRPPTLGCPTLCKTSRHRTYEDPLQDSYISLRFELGDRQKFFTVGRFQNH